MTQEEGLDLFFRILRLKQYIKENVQLLISPISEKYWTTRQRNHHRGNILRLNEGTKIRLEEYCHLLFKRILL